MALPEVTGYPQEHELRAMPLMERLAHAHRVAMTEDKESIELAAERIAELEAQVLRREAIIDSMHERTADLKAALAPFLEGVDEEHCNLPDDASIDLTVTVGDCRHARAALKNSGG